MNNIDMIQEFKFCWCTQNMFLILLLEVWREDGQDLVI